MNAPRACLFRVAARSERSASREPQGLHTNTMYAPVEGLGATRAWFTLAGIAHVPPTAGVEDRRLNEVRLFDLPRQPIAWHQRSAIEPRFFDQCSLKAGVRQVRVLCYDDLEVRSELLAHVK